MRDYFVLAPLSPCEKLWEYSGSAASPSKGSHMSCDTQHAMGLSTLASHSKHPGRFLFTAVQLNASLQLEVQWAGFCVCKKK